MEYNQKLIGLTRLIVTAKGKQRISILKNVTKEQCKLIREIAYNILFNTSITIEKEDKKYLKKYLLAIKLLASKKVCSSDKIEILAKKHLLIKRLAEIVYTYLVK